VYKVQCTLEGISPIRFNRITTMETGMGKPTQSQEEEHAKLRVYRNASGLFLPALNLKRAIRQGALRAGLKMGRSGFEPYVNAAVFIEPLELEFGKEEPDFLYPAWVRIPPGKRGALVYKVRPGLNIGWQLSPVFTVLDDHIDNDKLKAAVETTGLFIGICDGRPEFGRFIIKVWDKSGGVIR
jgi:hypothetical protein